MLFLGRWLKYIAEGVGWEGGEGVGVCVCVFVCAGRMSAQQPVCFRLWVNFMWRPSNESVCVRKRNTLLRRLPRLWTAFLHVKRKNEKLSPLLSHTHPHQSDTLTRTWLPERTAELRMRITLSFTVIEGMNSFCLFWFFFYISIF